MTTLEEQREFWDGVSEDMDTDAGAERHGEERKESGGYVGLRRDANGQERNADRVNHPSHYTQGGIECIDAIRAALGPEAFQAYCQGNAIKYLWRWKNKGGVEDVKKAGVYIRWMIESVENRKGTAI